MEGQSLTEIQEEGVQLGSHDSQIQGARIAQEVAKNGDGDAEHLHILDGTASEDPGSLIVSVCNKEEPTKMQEENATSTIPLSTAVISRATGSQEDGEHDGKDINSDRNEEGSQNVVEGPVTTSSPAFEKTSREGLISSPRDVAMEAAGIVDGKGAISEAAVEPTSTLPKSVEDKNENNVIEEEVEMPPDDVLMKRLRVILGEVDLNVTTEKMLRKMLQADFGVSMSSKKMLIRKEVEEYLKKHHNEEAEEEVEEEEDADNARKADGTRKVGKKRRHRFGDILSAPMSSFLGMESCPRTQVVKKLWEYIKSNNLQDPKNRRKIILDDKLKTIFPGKSINMFSMQKHLSKHVFVADYSEDEDEEFEEPKVKQVSKRSKKATSSAISKTGGSGSTKKSGFTKPCKIGPRLAEFLGSETASRPQVTKAMWDYVKENNLQDPENKQFILSDDKLLKLTGEKRFQGFSFLKLIKDQILGYVD